MSECIICKTECSGTTCSGSCRAKLSRRTRTQEPEAHAHGIEAHAPSARKEAHAGVTPTLQHYQANPTMYAARTNPEAINWGKPLSLWGLEKAGFKANRVSIPGDWDYAPNRDRANA